MKKSILRNKKGMIDDWLPFVGSVVLIIFVLIFFILIRSAEPVEKKFLEGEKEIEADQILLNYLRSSAKINDKELMFSDWINLLHHDGILIKETAGGGFFKFFYYNLEDSSKNIGSDFMLDTKDYFDKISRSYEIKIMEKKEIFRLLNIKSGISPETYSEIYIPNLNNELKIELKIALGALSK